MQMAGPGDDDSEASENRQSINNSKDYIENHVDKALHQALSDQGLVYSPNKDCFTERQDSSCEKDDLLSRRQIFARALKEYEEQAKPEYRTGLNLQKTFTWDDVLSQVEDARNQYEGVRQEKRKKGNLLSLRHRLKGFSKEGAPAIQQWLNLLPGDSLYASVLCGGISLILGAVVRVGQLREDTLDTLDQIPARVEKAESFVRTYGTDMEGHTIELYKAILDVLEHILRWYKEKAGIKFSAALCKGPTYANTLVSKMELVKKASGAIGDAADMGVHQRLKDIHDVASDTRNQTEALQKDHKELRKLTLEVVNHLYRVFKDADARQEFIEKSPSKMSHGNSHRGTFARRERDALLQKLGYDQDALMRDVEDALHGLTMFHSSDQDRVAAIIKHDTVQDWIVNLESQALLVHGNCRRDEIVSPTSTATAMLVRELFDTFSEKTSKVIILYWFCASNTYGPHGHILGMVRSLICQLLDRSFAFDMRSRNQLDSEDLNQLLDLLLNMLQQLPEGVIVVIFVDGVSFYEQSRQDDTCEVIGQLSSMVKSRRIFFKLFMTSPLHTSFLLKNSTIAKRVKVVEVS